MSEETKRGAPNPWLCEEAEETRGLGFDEIRQQQQKIIQGTECPRTVGHKPVALVLALTVFLITIENSSQMTVAVKLLILFYCYGPKMLEEKTSLILLTWLSSVFPLPSSFSGPLELFPFYL